MESLPDIDDAENFDDIEGITYIESIIKLLHCEENMLNDDNLKNLTLRLSNIYFFYDSFLDKVIEILMKGDICKIFDRIFVYLIKEDKIRSESLDKLLNFLINYSDSSTIFSAYILSSNIYHSLVDFCLDNHDSTFLDDTVNKDCIRNTLTVIHNVARDPTNVTNYRVDLLKETLMKYITYDKGEDLEVISVLTLSYIIVEDETNLLDGGLRVVNILIEKIKSVNNIDGRSGGFTVEELLNGLRCLSANDSMKRKIHEKHGVEMLLTFLDDKWGVVEKELALRIIWTLCFDNVIKDALTKEYRIEERIKPFRGHENEQIRKNCEGISWEIGRNKESTTPPASSHKFDVFISYSWKYKDVIQEIQKEMLGSRLTVWIDDEQMFGSTIGAMANGIENSTVFVIAISEAYRQSPNCRSEAEYAYTLRKPMVPVILQEKFKPRNWLGLIVGSRMYYEFSARRDHDTTMAGILSGVRRIMDRADNDDDEPEVRDVVVQKRALPCSQSVDPVVVVVSDAVRNWTKVNVAKWLMDAGMSNLRKPFWDVDGTLLEVLVEMRNTSPEYLNRTLAKEFGMKFVDVLKFHKALNSLANVR